MHAVDSSQLFLGLNSVIYLLLFQANKNNLIILKPINILNWNRKFATADRIPVYDNRQAIVFRTM